MIQRVKQLTINNDGGRLQFIVTYKDGLVKRVSGFELAIILDEISIINYTTNELAKRVQGKIKICKCKRCTCHEPISYTVQSNLLAVK